MLRQLLDKKFQSRFISHSGLKIVWGNCVGNFARIQNAIYLAAKNSRGEIPPPPCMLRSKQKHLLYDFRGTCLFTSGKIINDAAEVWAILEALQGLFVPKPVASLFAIPTNGVQTS